MIDLIFIILIFLATLMMMITYTYKEPWSAFASSVFWFSCALGSMSLEIPYQMYNASANMIETGTQVINDLTVPFIFVLLGVVMFISFVVLILENFSYSFSRKK